MIHRENGLIYTVAILNQLNSKHYKLENFEEDSKCLEKLLNAIGMIEFEENLELVQKKCMSELTLDTKYEISQEDKHFILKYL